MEGRKDLYDCWLQIGQLDPEDPFYMKYLMNEKYRVVRTRKAVTAMEAQSWCEHQGVHEAYKIEKEDSSLYVCYFFTVHDPNWDGPERSSGKF